MYGIKPECLICYCVAGFRHGFLAAISADISQKIFAITSRALWCHVALSQLIIIACFVMLSACPILVSADDTEIYLGPSGNNANIKHNVLFIFDTSASMNRTVRVDDNNDGDTDDPGENRGTRLEILRQVMNTLIFGLDNLKVGYMRMNGGHSVSDSGTSLRCNQLLLDQGAQTHTTNAAQRRPNGRNACYVPTGGSILFPVTDLDTDIADVPNASQVVPVYKGISSGNADAQQPVPAGGAINLSANTLDIGATQCVAANIVTATAQINSNADDAREFFNNDGTPLGAVYSALDSDNVITIGRHLSAFRFRFPGDGPPRNSLILEARIRFTAMRVAAGDLDIPVYGAPGAPRTGNFSTISGLSTTSASVSWTGVPAVSSVGEQLITPGLVNIAQELVNNVSWTGGSDSMTFIFQNAGTGAGSDPARYVTNGIAGSARSMLEITYCSQISSSPVPQQLGLNFSDVGVPQGASIEAAYIEFTAAAGNLNTGAAGSQVTIRGDDVDNSAIFSSSGDIRSRTGTTASVAWTAQQMGSWSTGEAYTTPDLKTIVSEIVERSGWCGGNDMSFILTGNSSDLLRRAQSADLRNSAAPRLRIEYTNVYDANDTGCNEISDVSTITRNTRGATAAGSTETLGFRDNVRLGGRNSAVTGLAFRLPVPRNAVVVEAVLELTTADRIRSPLAININVEDTVDPAPLADGRTREFATTRRPRFTGAGRPLAVTLQTNPVIGATIGIDVSTLVTAMINRPDWELNKRIHFIFERVNSLQELVFGSPTASLQDKPRLRLTFRENTANNSPRTVRDHLLQLNEKTLVSSNTLYWTPSVETLYEAASYWRGGAVHFGRRRGLATINGNGVVDDLVVRRNSSGHSIIGSINFSSSMQRTLTSHPASWTGGSYSSGLPDPDQVTTDCRFSHDPRCRYDRITGNPRYISPIQETDAQCARSYQIFLTDGAPTANNQSTLVLINRDFHEDIRSTADCSVDPAVNARTHRGRCAVEMIRSLNSRDQRPSVPGIQTVRTDTIAFNLNSPASVRWLQQLADAGGGSFYSANDATELISTFNAIFGDILQAPRAFTAPAISANAFNRLFSRDEIYFGLFEVDVTARWSGNVKKYNVCDRVDQDSDGVADCTLGDVLDASDSTAVSNGAFIPSSTSVWSSEEDGGLLRVGGAGDELTGISQRIVYTDLDSAGTPASGNLSVDGHRIDSTNWNSISGPDLTHIHAAVCPTPGDLSSGSDCEERMLWLLGQDVQDEDSDGNITELRWWFSDVLHSSPAVVSYGLDNKGTPDVQDDEFIDRILVGTNGGGIHMINGSSGREEWSFVPAVLMPNFQVLYDNTQAQHVYGMDLTPVIWFVDINNNGTIEPPADKVHAYLGMRRGGNNYYALNITPTSTLTSVTGAVIPRLLWRIQGGSSTTRGNFSRLAQTWSEPVIARIRCSANTDCPAGSKTVLIFGGGYDERLDVNSAFDIAPNNGNAIYIVDAENGDLITWISHAAVAAEDSNPAIPASGADIEVPDMLYSIMSQVTVFDSDSDGFSDRIYVGDAGGQVWRVDLGSNITIGSISPEGDTIVGKLANISTAGNSSAERRFHYKPAVVQVNDSRYSDVTGGNFDYVVLASGDRANPLNVDVRDRLYAFRDQNIGTMSGASGIATSYPLGTTGSTAIAEADMIDVTAQVLDSSDTAHLSSLGWYYNFDTAGTGTGQKGLSAPIIAAGNVLLTSYLPPDQSANNAACSASEGNGFSHNFNILSAAATQNWDGDGAVDPIADRSSALGGGIPSEVIPIFTREGVTLSVGTGQGPENLGTISTLPRYRSYWADEMPSQ